MKKLDHPEINTSELTAEVRRAMARQVLKSHARSTDGSDLTGHARTQRPEEDDSTPATLLSTDVNFDSLHSQLNSPANSPQLKPEHEPVFQPNAKDQYHLNDLLKSDDADFLTAAYRAVLKRDPDNVGYNYYLEQLRAGHIDKVDALAILRFSSEGKLKNVQIEGLALSTFIRRLGHLPVIGYPIRLVLDLLRLPVLMHRMRQHEARLLAQNRKVAEHANEVAIHVETVNKAFAGYLSNISAAVSDLLKSTDLQTKRHGLLMQQLASLAKHQQESLIDLRQELLEQIDNERASAQEQTQLLIRQQQSLLDSSTKDTRARIAQLESSARAWIAQLDSSIRAWTAELDSSARTRTAELDSFARARTAELESFARTRTAELESSFHAKIARIESSTNDIGTKLTGVESTASDLQGRLGSVEAAANDLRTATDKLDSETNTTQAEIGKVFQHLQQARAELALQGRRMALILEEARSRLPAPLDQQQREIIATEEQHKLDALYADLEDNFRGTYEEIKERCRTYLPEIKSLNTASDLPIVDLGCGRGEWLELLKEEGYKALGVDTNQVLLDRCRARGLEVIDNDALKYLRGLPDNSLSAITGFHIIEHLQIAVLISLLDEIVRVLLPGGLVIFETPNPENVLVGSNFFYFDPTHRNPVPSLLVKFLLESRGFDRIEVMNLHAWDQARIGGKNELTARFNELFYGPMDYAIAGWKGLE